MAKGFEIYEFLKIEAIFQIVIANSYSIKLKFKTLTWWKKVVGF